MSKVIAGLGLAAFVAIAVMLAPPRGAIVLPSATPFVAPAEAASATTPATPTPLPPIPPGYRVQIPRLAIDLPILEGDLDRDTVQQQTPEGYAFHLPGTAIPGMGANAYLYAHARRGMFLSLWDARIGDVVWISTPDGRALKYIVTEVHSHVPPDDLSWTLPSPPDRLTLQTSTGPNPGDPRFVVIAQLS